MGSRRRLHTDGENVALGDRIRLVRSKAGVTQVALADRLGWTQSQVGKVERGERIVAALELRDICRVLGVAVGAILDD